MTFASIFPSTFGAVSVIEIEQRIAQRVPIELLKRDKILARGRWALNVQSCPAGTSSCNTFNNDGCCSSTLFCDAPGFAAAEACCPGTNDCTAALGATPFCADDSWALWAPSSGYFCCLQGETGLLSGACASNDEVIASSLTASYVGVSIISGATFQTSKFGAGGSSITTTTSSHLSTVTMPPSTTTTSSDGGGIEATLKSVVSAALHNGAALIAVGQPILGSLLGAILASLL